jgi:hypothetical protein
VAVTYPWRTDEESIPIGPWLGALKIASNSLRA